MWSSDLFVVKEAYKLYKQTLLALKKDKQCDIAAFSVAKQLQEQIDETKKRETYL